MRYNGYGINWTEFVRHVLDLPSTREVVVCCVRLSRPLQHLLEITPKTSLWQFAILHTLVHSDLFLLVSGHNSQFSRNAPNFRIHPGTSSSFADGAQENITPQSPEGECLDLVEYVIPSLKNALHCDSEALQDSSVQVESHSEQLRLSLFGILKELFHISAEKSWMITNSTVNKVKTNVLSFLSSFRQNQEQEPTSLDLDEYDFSSNILELVKVRNQQYFSGKVRTRGLPADMTAFGIRACFKGS